VEDYSHQRSATQMKITSNGNVFQRPSANAPKWVVVWSRGAGNPAVYTTLEEFASATGQDRNSYAVDGKAVLSNRTTLTPAVSGLTSTVARGIPARIAAVTGQATGAKHLGVWG
jgi:hypothetical protein